MFNVARTSRRISTLLNKNSVLSCLPHLCNPLIQGGWSFTFGVELRASTHRRLACRTRPPKSSFIGVSLQVVASSHSGQIFLLFCLCHLCLSSQTPQHRARALLSQQGVAWNRFSHPTAKRSRKVLVIGFAPHKSVKRSELITILPLTFGIRVCVQRGRKPGPYTYSVRQLSHALFLSGVPPRCLVAFPV